ncbi:MAG: hypothetical protein ACOYOH_07575, partial [Paracraurococcus sp.]
MAQIDYTGTAGADLLDASGLAAGSNAVLRGGAGADTLLGSSGNDRFDGGAGADSMAGGAGNDTFFLAYSAAPGQGFDTIDAGTGADQVVITMNGSQVNDAAVQAELAAINTWSKGDTSVAFNSTLFNFSMVSAETVSVRVDGQ